MDKDLLKRSTYFYDLPEELIAQDPLEKRDESRLLILGKESGNIEHKSFKNIIEYLEPNDYTILSEYKKQPKSGLIFIG